MEQLPIELRRVVIEHTDFSALKSLRLTSKAWAALGEEYLMPSAFKTLPHRPDMLRLSAIAKHPKFSYRIQSIEFNHGEINEYHARHNTYFQLYMQDPESRLAAATSAWNKYAEIKEEKERHLPLACALDALTEALSSLPNLKSIEVTLMTCPFQEEIHPNLLMQVWRIPSTRLLPRVATTERFTSILGAIAANLDKASIKSISHDRLPFEFFAQRQTLLEHIATTFAPLTRLKLCIDYSDMPNSIHSIQAFGNLSMFLRSAVALQKLTLSFQGRKKTDISSLISSFREHGFSFQELQELVLENFIARELDLGDFLKSQKRVKMLRLGGKGIKTTHQPANGGVHLSDGSFVALFDRLKNGMQLDTFRLQGDLIGQESGERWILENEDDQSNLNEYVLD